MADMSAEIPGQNEGVKSVEPKKDAKPKVFLTYRDNDFYQTAIPAMAGQLRASGFDVGVVNFPAGTPEDEIRKGLEEKKEDFRDAVVLTDGTVQKSWSQPRFGELKSMGAMVNPNPTSYIKGDLDNRFSRGVIDAISGNSQFAMYYGEMTDEEIDALGDKPSEFWLETHGKAYIALFRAAFQKERPDWITIDPARLTDHEPFMEYYEDLAKAYAEHTGANYEEAKKLIDSASSTLASREPLPDELHQKLEEAGIEVKLPADFIKQWIVEAGFPAENIEPIAHVKRENPGNLMDPFTWVRDTKIPQGAKVWNISDRHNRKGFLQVPIENFVQNLQGRGLISNESVSLEALSKSVAERIERDVKAAAAEKVKTAPKEVEIPTPDQASAPEPEVKNFRELRESLVRLGEAEPGLICQTTKDGKPEVIVIPGRDNESIEGQRGPIDPLDTTVAISDDAIRILDIVPRHYTRDVAGRLRTINLPASDYFRPDKNGKVRTEEEIKADISYGGTGRGHIQERSYEKDPEVKMRVLLESLSYRNEESTRNSKGSSEAKSRFAELKKSFDPKTLKPGEDLAARFNDLAQRLSAAPKA